MAIVAVEARRIFLTLGGDFVVVVAAALVAPPRGVVETTFEDATGRTVGLGRTNAFRIFLRLGACFVVAVAVALAVARGVVVTARDGTGRTVGLTNAFTKSLGAVVMCRRSMDSFVATCCCCCCIITWGF